LKKKANNRMTLKPMVILCVRLMFPDSSTGDTEISNAMVNPIIKDKNYTTYSIVILLVTKKPFQG
jgi:hypothetical protein